MAVITDPETATGFRLAGVEVHEAASPAEALQHLKQLVALGYGLAAVNEALLQGTEEELARMLRGRDLPILVPFPAPGAQVESGDDYIARLVKEHIGFYVKLR
ncbi:MAG: V-type ATP synthase subunit F [Armatimonadota bacterium]|nr:V-type ATP synthase subunit F [Armatimonadota bacterium]MDR7426896.1 V-type ATP synthase subunit F [Armatimonadota bacterium]MDR7463494.1 V-type ATP synthase subunit F [Armatimonadota bacterium]MDR7470567.1 V-type ATP synthase subunit F [Armatimonadota bacterium]MDR7474161.1 V-type ATP synthase subunit F [Armatimonadota bacterium]